MSLKSVLTGSDLKVRKTRFHDEKGNLISAFNFFINGPKALLSSVALKLFGVRPQQPWLSYTAVREISRFLNKQKDVLEFGSGMSTVWLAKHSGFVHSVDNYEPWYEKVKEILTEEGIANVNYNYRQGEEYYTFINVIDRKFDFILIDGYAREKCVEVAIKRIKEGGMIYLDNSDKDYDPAFAKDNTRLAEDTLLAFAKEKGASVTYYSDFAPTAFFVQQGLMIKL